jgi:hypothetical protein
MILCDFCDDGITEATHTTTSGDRVINLCYACMTAFTWGQSSPQSQVLRLPGASDDQEDWVAIRVFFQDGREVLIHARQDEDAKGEIAEWCRWHGVPYDGVADFTVVQDNGERKEVHPP